MHCDGCVQAITDKVKHVDGVVDCRVSLADRQADVVVRDDTTALPVQHAIEKLGYKVKPLPAPTAAAAPAAP
jgi:copper chaperone CopZ